MEFSSDQEMRKIPGLLEEFLQYVAYDYEPLFIGDEATIWSVSMETAEEMLRRCSEHYGTPVSMNDLKQPLWILLPQLDARRGTGREKGRTAPEIGDTHDK